MSELLVAVATSVVVALVVVLAVALVVRFARPVVRSIIRSVRESGLRSDDAADAATTRWGRGRTAGIVVCLALAAVAGLVGIFVPLYRDFPRPGRSISLYNTMHYSAITAYLELAFLGVLAYLAFLRRDRLIAAMIVGYCATAVVSFGGFATSFNTTHGHYGPGYYLLGVSYAAGLAAVVVSLGVVVRRTADRRAPSAPSALLGFTSAILIAGALAMYASKPVGLPLWTFSSVPGPAAAAMIVGIVAVAGVPLLALRLADRCAAFMVLGLATSLAFGAADAYLGKLYAPRFTELTVGFWLTTLAVVTLVLLAFMLTPRTQREVHTRALVGAL